MQRQSVRDLPTNKNPTGTRCIQITIPDDDEWEQHLFSEAYRLALWMLWARDPTKSGAPVAKRWREALATWAHCDGSPTPMGVDLGDDLKLRIKPGSDCIIQRMCDCDDEWSDWYDPNNCIDDAIDNRTGQQTGGGQPEPGDCVTYHATMPGNNMWLLPVSVNAGDTVTVSGATGASYDGGPSTWNCASGETYFAGACVEGTGGLQGGDPLAVKHNRLIAKLVSSLGTTYYDAYNQVITIPSGVVGGTLSFQTNDSVLGDNAGTIQFTAIYCANGTAPSDAFHQCYLSGKGVGDWTTPANLEGHNAGSYDSGTDTIVSTAIGGGNEWANAHLALTATLTLLKATIAYDNDSGSEGCDLLLNGTTVQSITTPVGTGVIVLSWAGSQDITEIGLVTSAHGNIAIVGIEIAGTSATSFPPNNC